MNTDKTSTRPEMVTCTICNQSQPLSSMAATVDDGAGTIGHCCYVCEGEQVGRKFEDATALVLHHWSMDSSEDEYMSAEGFGYCGRFGRFLLVEDSQGFVQSFEYADAAKASATFEDWYSEGWGYSEDDATISEDRGRWYVSFEGKQLDLWPNHDDEISERRAIARVRLETMRTGYYPNLWRIGERGDVRLLTY